MGEYKPRSVERFYPSEWRRLSSYACKYVYKLYRRISELESRTKELEAQLAKYSANSHLPPSRDFQPKPRPQSVALKRGRPVKRKPGAQAGHAGSTLKMTDEPKWVHAQNLLECPGCGLSLKDTEISHIERRQVFDVPVEFKVEVTEYRVEHRHCGGCHQTVGGSFPKDVNAPVQYGPNLRALAAYLMHAQMLPYNRVREVLRELFGVDMGHGTIARINELYFNKLSIAEESAREQLSASLILHVDETGLKNNGEQNWLHVMSNEELTLLVPHQKRGGQAVEEIGVLKNFEGRMIHDHWPPYYKVKNCSHAACNAHHLRELTFVGEDLKEPWALKMKDLLLEMHEKVESAKGKGQNHLQGALLERLERRYDQVLVEAARYHQKILPKPGVLNQGKGLMNRLRERRGETLVFMHDFAVPFTNNQAERDLRMAKLKQKVSGTFRTEQGMKDFARIRSYISTARKQNWPVLYALQMAIKDKVLIPSYPL